jgi:hypothetical protein
LTNGIEVHWKIRNLASQIQEGGARFLAFNATDQMAFEFASFCWGQLTVDQ